MSRAGLLGRLLLAPVTLLGVTLVTFALVHAAPGDPALLRAGQVPGVTAEVIAENRALAGLDRPLGERYLRWVARSARLDFGASLRDGRPVRERMAEALPRSLALGALAAAIAALVGGLLGLYTGWRRGRPLATAIDLGVGVLLGLPSLVLGLLALRAGAAYGDGTGALVAAAACLSVPTLGLLQRQQREAISRTLDADHLLAARARGLGPAALLRHALRGSLGPVVTLLGTQVPVLLSGSVIVEQVFGVRGLGMLALEAMLGRDYPTLMGLATLSAALTLAGVLAADLALLALDPRLRREGGR